MEYLPTSVLSKTDWLLMENTDVTNVQGSAQVFHTIKFLDLRYSKLNIISDEFLGLMSVSKSLK